MGAGPSRAHIPGNPVGRLPKEGTAPARQQSTTAWKGPLVGETFGKSRPRACPWGLLGSEPEEQNVPFTKGGAGWGWGWDFFSKWGAMGYIADTAPMHRVSSDKPPAHSSLLPSPVIGAKLPPGSLVVLTSYGGRTWNFLYIDVSISKPDSGCLGPGSTSCSIHSSCCFIPASS